MSLILDALRRMEQDRTNRRQGAPGIRPEVLRYRGKPQKPPRKLLAPVAVGLLLISAGIGAGVLLRQDRTAPPPQPAPRKAPASAVPEAQPAPAPASAAPAPPLPSAQINPPAASPVPARTIHAVT